MNVIEMLAGATAGNLEFLKMILGDFTDADLWVRPCANANTAGWQLGHLIAGETMMVGSAGGTMPELPASLRALASDDAAKIDKPSPAPTKAELLAQLGKTRAATVQWIRSLKPEDLDRPSPERMRAHAPTLAQFILLLNGHITMHAGQMQVIRRKLGKPLLF